MWGDLRAGRGRETTRTGQGKALRRRRKGGDLLTGACPGAAGRELWWWGAEERRAAEGETDFSAILLYLTHSRL